MKLVDCRINEKNSLLKFIRRQQNNNIDEQSDEYEIHVYSGDFNFSIKCLMDMTDKFKKSNKEIKSNNSPLT